jgi:hypothetical protein
MKKICLLVVAVLSLLVAPVAMCAQENSSSAASATTPPPKVLAVFREFLKPGKNGSIHEKSESTFVQAWRRAKWPTHYLAVDSLSGETRTLFLTGYDSFDAWEKDVQATQNNPTLAATINRAAIADGDLLSKTDSSAWVYNPDHSFDAPVDLANMHYFEIDVFHVKQGHDTDWDQIMKLVIEAYQRIPNTHWAAYDSVFGANGGTHVFLVPMKNAWEIDHNLASQKDFVDAMGEDGMKKLEELTAAAIESSENNIFVFNPRMSYVPEEWIQANPDFWKPKATAAPAKKPGEKKNTEAQPQ